MFQNDYAGIKLCGIAELSECRGRICARSGVQRSSLVKQWHDKQVMSLELAATRRVQEDRAVVSNEIVVK
jgi:hypothetical protein